MGDNKVLRLAGVALFAFGVLSALGIWKQGCRRAERDRKLDERLDESFPASDAVAKY